MPLAEPTRNSPLQERVKLPTLDGLKETPSSKVVSGECAGPALCPLSSIRAGAVVCVKQLAVTPDLVDRLREMGLGEEQRVRLVSSQASVICQVCNARVAISQQLAEAILVEPISG